MLNSIGMHVEFDPRLYSLSSNPEHFSKRSGFLIGVLRKGPNSYLMTCSAFHPDAELDTRLEHILAFLQHTGPTSLSSANPKKDYRICLKKAEFALRISAMAAKSNASRQALLTCWWGKLLLKLPVINRFFSHWHVTHSTYPDLAGHCLVSALDQRLQELSPFDPDLHARIQRVMEHYHAYVQEKPLLTAQDLRFTQLERLQHTLSYLHEHQLLEKEMRASNLVQLEKNRSQLEHQIRQAELTHFQLYKTIGHPIWITLHQRLAESYSRLLQPFIPQLTAARTIVNRPLEYAQTACETFLNFDDEDNYQCCEEKFKARLKTLEMPEEEFKALPPTSRKLLEAARTKLKSARGYLIAQHLLRCKKDERSFKEIVESEREHSFVVNATAMLDVLTTCCHPDARHSESYLAEAFKAYLLTSISKPLLIVQSGRPLDATHRYYPYDDFHNFHMAYHHVASCFIPLLAILKKAPGNERLIEQVHQARVIGEQIYLAQARREIGSYALAVGCQLPDAAWKRLPLEILQGECKKIAEKLKIGHGKLQGILAPYTELLQQAHTVALNHLEEGYARAEMMLFKRATPAPNRSHQTVLLHLLRIQNPQHIEIRMKELQEWAFPVPLFAEMKCAIENAYANDARFRKLQAWCQDPVKWKQSISSLTVDEAFTAYKQLQREIQIEHDLTNSQSFATLLTETHQIFFHYMQSKLVQFRAASQMIMEFNLAPPVLGPASLHDQTLQMEFLVGGALRSISLNDQQAAYPKEVLAPIHAAREKVERARLEWLADRVLLVEFHQASFVEDHQRICAALGIPNLTLHKQILQKLVLQLHPDKHPDLPELLKNKLDSATRYLLKSCRL